MLEPLTLPAIGDPTLPVPIAGSGPHPLPIGTSLNHIYFCSLETAMHLILSAGPPTHMMMQYPDEFFLSDRGFLGFNSRFLLSHDSAFLVKQLRTS